VGQSGCHGPKNHRSNFQEAPQLRSKIPFCSRQTFVVLNPPIAIHPRLWVTVTPRRLFANDVKTNTAPAQLVAGIKVQIMGVVRGKGWKCSLDPGYAPLPTPPIIRSLNQNGAQDISWTFVNLKGARFSNLAALYPSHSLSQHQRNTL